MRRACKPCRPPPPPAAGPSRPAPSPADTQHELAASGGANIRALLDEANAAHGRVTKPRECAVDVQVFGIITESGLNHVNRLAHNGKGYSAADLVARLKTRYVDHVDAQEVGAADPAAFDWGALGRGLAGWFRTAPHCHHMLGPMDAAPKAKRVMAQRRKKDAIGARCPRLRAALMAHALLLLLRARRGVRRRC